EQMKMFLTRIGFNSKAVITGDITQVDLPRGAKSGLRHAIEVLSEVDDISFNFFNAEDVVRHPVVARIVRAYEVHDAEQERLRKARKEEALRLQREQASQDDNATQTKDDNAS
ncbi:MAG: PhoH family protein, partial [Pseudomonadota bacterium]|nr:PhoH family protein [Pseudomonadota bacterium]